MFVKDLSDSINLTKVKVRLPEEVIKKYRAYYGGEPEMWIAGGFMGDFFLSPDPPGVKPRRLYPMPENVKPSDLLDWEVVSNLN